MVVAGRVVGQSFTNPQQTRGPEFRTPPRNRVDHAEKLERELDRIRRHAQEIQTERQAAGLATDFGLVIEFASEPDFPLKAQSLERRRSGIQLLNLRTLAVQLPNDRTAEAQFATVRVPYGKLDVLHRLIESYRSKETEAGTPKNQELIDSVAQIREAAIEAFWTEGKDMPAVGAEAWWEAWLHTGPNGDERELVRQRFEVAAKALGVHIAREEISLPENTVLLIRARREQLSQSLDLLNCLTELRAPQAPAEFFAAMDQVGQAEWVAEARQRLSPPSPAANAVCLLDSGVNHEHPLLQPVVAQDGLESYEPAWGTADDTIRPHGSMMAGIAAFGDLTKVLLSTGPIQPAHWVESVKMINSSAPQQPHLYGHVTRQSISRIEIAAPRRPRVFSMQVTDPNTAERGRPTSWSAALDELSSGYGEEGNQKRLIFVSAGNVHVERSDEYPAKNETEQIHDPNQAWNAVSVGGFTDKAVLSDPTWAGWRPLAARGGLAPASSTSLIWDHDWPLKPDIVLEAGNRIAEPETGVIDRHGDVELLTTNANWRSRLLTTTGDTSAAAAEAARYAALIQAAYPGLWPETIRALLVHSATWTSQMLDRRLPAMIGKVEWKRILRTYGFGVPNLAAALRSARSAVTLLCQDELQPFLLEDGVVRTNELRFHNLPWPRQVLQTLGETPVEMRVTLSYFIEPNPGPRLPTNRYRYGSCNLRFDVRRSTESEAEFRARINAEARTDDEDGAGTESDSSEWLLGAKLRHRGSLHSDVWQGTAADLAQKNHIAVFPLNGWWRLRKHLRQYHRRLRYALVVSIRTPAVGVDLYTPVETEIRTLVPIASL